MTAYYITGTDTGAGKTFASVALVHALRRGGTRAVGMKPVASGCEATPAGLRNEDALALQAASDPRPDYALVNPLGPARSDRAADRRRPRRRGGDPAADHRRLSATGRYGRAHRG